MIDVYKEECTDGNLDSVGAIFCVEAKEEFLLAESFYCEKCNRTMSADQFYGSNNLEKYQPDGKLHMCKKCATAHINNWDPDTYLWILQEIDVPYVPDEWNKLLMKYG